MEDYTLKSNEQQICPWCQMEITWDPEIGPESECPYCLNELGEYRTLPLHVLTGGAVKDDDDDDEDELDSDADIEEEDEDSDELKEEFVSKYKNDYAERVAQCLDTQAEAPECFRCQELMLLAGTQKVESGHFKPVSPEALGRPFLRIPFALHLYVCPSCFKTDTILSPDDRTAMVEIIKGKHG